MKKNVFSNDPPWLEAGDPLPDAALAWGPDDPLPGLVALGGDLSTDTLLQAYRQGIFPWFSEGQPILWHSPDPRMVLQVAQFKLHRSLRKTILQFIQQDSCELRFDSAFPSVIRACASSQRPGQGGTWIVPEMIDAYEQLHRAGYAHSVETWVNGELVGGLYCVAIGKAVFGESMFTRQSNASKIALAALVAFCQAHDLPQIDCQQNTPHLASMGAQEMTRAQFVAKVQNLSELPPPQWQFTPELWHKMMQS